MPKITFNAFSFLQKKLKAKNIAYANVQMDIETGSTPKSIMNQMGLGPEDVEIVMVNGKAAPFDTELKENDRLALIPPGTPGPYRVYLGFKNEKNRYK